MAGLIERLTVLCFAGTYALALASDLARFVVRWPGRWYLTVGLTALGWVVQAAYLANRPWPPVQTPFESLLVLAWVLAGIDIYLRVHAPRPGASGLFLMPLVLGLLVAGSLSPRAGWVGGLGTASPVIAFWGMAHGILLVAGAVCSCVAFAAGLMYLVQSSRLKHKRAPRFGLALPSLEESERLNRGAIIVAFPLLTAGLVIGVILTVAVQRSEGAAIGWGDPKVISTLVMWVAFAVLLHARFRPAMRGRRVMLLSIVAFLFLAFSLFGVELLHLPTAHGGARTAADPAGGRP